MLKRGAFALVALVIVAIAYLLLSDIHFRAYLCPACAGFSKVAPKVYIDGRATDAQITTALDSLAVARAQLQKVYPDPVSNPVWLLCLSGDCGVTDGPRPRALAYANRFVFVYPDGATPVILTHELAHTELHTRLGTLHRLFVQDVPAWFDEGVAVIASEDARFLEIGNGQVIGCKAGNWPEPPSDRRSFRRQGATETVALYTASACKTIAWLEKYGGISDMPFLLAQIRAGQLRVE